VQRRDDQAERQHSGSEGDDARQWKMALRHHGWAESIRTVPTFQYRPEVVDELARHGLRPRPHTPPDRVREQLSDLYRYELRRLRGRLLAGEFPRQQYAELVVATRRRYVLLSIPIDAWTVLP
jgi:hypothetical protein